MAAVSIGHTICLGGLVSGSQARALRCTASDEACRLPFGSTFHGGLIGHTGPPPYLIISSAFGHQSN